ncbi:MAG: tRNA pseudouridine(38-40) synthase TruA [Blastocatellia bacterium]
MKAWKLILEYDGTRYSGWQEQLNARTVQGELRKAAEDIFDTRVDLGGAGRTDAGVHALGQAAHMRVDTRRAGIRSTPQPREMLYALNDRLPADICILDVSETGTRFHARHDAVSRTYLYQISMRRTAFEKKYVWWIKDNLDTRAMTAAAGLFPGRHDFAAFSKRDAARPGESTVVVVEAAGIRVENQRILFRITASHFLWNMVRRLTGTLVEVGRHNIEVAAVADMLAGRTAANATWTAPPSGLFLEKVIYRD